MYERSPRGGSERRVISGERRRCNAAPAMTMIDDRADKGDRRHKRGARFSAAETRGGKRPPLRRCRCRRRRRSFGLSVINYPIVKAKCSPLPATRRVLDDSVVKSSDSGERCITVISPRIARKHRSRGARERGTGLRVINPTIDETYPSRMLRSRVRGRRGGLRRAREGLRPSREERRHDD